MTTENTDKIDNALAGLRQNIGANLQPYVLAVSIVNDEDRKQLIAGVMNAMCECLGRYLGTLEFQGILVEGSSVEEAVAGFKNEHLLALTEREKAVRDACGVGCDA